MGKVKLKSSKDTSSVESSKTMKMEERKMRAKYKKERHKAKDYSSPEEVAFNNMLVTLGIRIKYVDGDGNCLFRSIADQLTGSESNHYEFRDRIVKYIEQNRNHFSLFMEDDEPFDDYVDRMRHPCEWGGHQELYAASQCLQVNIIVHQVNAPRFILNSELPSKRDIHISYHGEVHYNSIRSVDDPDRPDAPAVEIDLERNSSCIKSESNHKKLSTKEQKLADIVQNSLPWMDMSDIINALSLVDNRVDDAIEYLISSKVTDSQSLSPLSASASASDSYAYVAKATDVGNVASAVSDADFDADVAAAIAASVATADHLSSDDHSKLSKVSTEKKATDSNPNQRKVTSKEEKKRLKEQQRKEEIRNTEKIDKSMSKKDKRLAKKGIPSKSATNTMSSSSCSASAASSGTTGAGGVLEIVL